MVERALSLPSADDSDRVYDTLPESAWQLLRGRRIFVTGGTGFVGKWLLISLIDINRRLGLDVRVTVLSRNPSAFIDAMPTLVTAPELTFVQGDVRDFEFPTGRYDTIIHAATDVVANSTPEEIFSTCVDGIRRVLQFAKLQGTKDLLLISSGAVYGKQPSDLEHVPETYLGAPDPLSLSSAYGEGKRAAEWLSIASGQSGLAVKIARCFAFVGPYLQLDKQFAIGNFIKAAINGEEIVIKGDGTPYRSYLYAADMAGWLWGILLIGRPSIAYNVGSEDAISIKDLAVRISHVLNAKNAVRIVGKRDKTLKPERYVPSHQMIVNELGVPQPIAIDEAVTRTAMWHRNMLRSEK